MFDILGWVYQIMDSEVPWGLTYGFPSLPRTTPGG